MIDLDVMVVYSSNSATSASVSDAKSTHPFALNSAQSNYNASYAFFLDSCKEQGLRAGFTTSSDIIAPGTCQDFWTHKSGIWKKSLKKAYSQNIFDKISPISQVRRDERALLLSDKLVRPFNHRDLHNLFFDKLLTYTEFPNFMIPTVDVPSSLGSTVQKAIKQLESLKKQHSNSQDFKDSYILKDRFGAGGNYIFKITIHPVDQIVKILKKHSDVRFILQPFLNFDKGFTHKKTETATDIRLIFSRNKILQSYIRMAKIHDFRCNMHQGGKLVYVSQKEIPKKVRVVAKRLSKHINKPHSLYALDFAISNTGQVYCIEGNTGPGINWEANKRITEDEEMSKQLILHIVNEFVQRID